MIMDDYALAGIPTLPVVKTVRETKMSILQYTVVLVALTLVFATSDAVGVAYTAAASLLGVIFIYSSWRLSRRPGITGAKSAYLYSLLYLALLFMAMAADVFFIL